jgi:hypothetical protein
MPAQLQLIHGHDMSKHAFAMREQYYALRKRAFEARWGENLYPDGPNDYDLRADTVFALLVEDGKVIAGTRVVFHPIGSDVKTPMEINHPNFTLSNLLPPVLATPHLSYAELGGIVADPDPAYRGRHLGTKITEGTLNLIRAKVIRNNDQPVEVVITSASDAGLGPIVRSVSKLKLKGILRCDLIQQEEDSRFDTKLYPMVIAFKPHWKLATPDMEAVGTAQSIADFATSQKRIR